ncbi:hypothetical protein ERJ75_001516600 [Trypanosoma vivax]|nr:hypothetical protein ERJ75_001517400 [Trypanosoma vivax]KAH8606429.1 hypothetical protein ERJ75_001517000 [Trypanosoma vivax]KAH8606457.1 hypothetical protein ERJ75_001516600 [Trypanosoma vivax]
MRGGSCCLSAWDVERNPGPQIRGAQCNSGDLSRAKRVAPERKLREDMVLFGLLQDTRLASAECAAFEIAGWRHVGQAKTPHGGGASILVRGGVGEEMGVLEKKVPERQTSPSCVRALIRMQSGRPPNKGWTASRIGRRGIAWRYLRRRPCTRHSVRGKRTF